MLKNITFIQVCDQIVLQKLDVFSKSILSSYFKPPFFHVSSKHHSIIPIFYCFLREVLIVSPSWNHSDKFSLMGRQVYPSFIAKCKFFPFICIPYFLSLWLTFFLNSFWLMLVALLKRLPSVHMLSCSDFISSCDVVFEINYIFVDPKHFQCLETSGGASENSKFLSSCSLAHYLGYRHYLHQNFFGNVRYHLRYKILS